MNGGTIDDGVWSEARSRAGVVARTLPDAPAGQRLSLAEAARELGVDRSTVFRWRARFETERRLSALLPQHPGRPQGHCQIDPRVGDLVETQIETFHLRPERPSIRALVDRIRAECRRVGLPAPHWRTVRLRIDRTLVVTGFYLGLDRPSILRTGVYAAQSVFEKGTRLAERGIDVPWPVSRLPRAVHADNAGEFHSSAFTRALEDFGVEAIYRPIALWEHSRATERLRAQGRKEVSEDILSQAVREQRRIEDEAPRWSRRARRVASQRPAAPVAASTLPLDRGVIDTSDPNLPTLPLEILDGRRCG